MSKGTIPVPKVILNDTVPLKLSKLECGDILSSDNLEGARLEYGKYHSYIFV